jgi:anti-anti-sigma factor
MSTTASYPVFYPTRILSVDSSETLLEWIDQQLQNGHKTLLIDFRNVTFMDSTGLGALVSAFKAVQLADSRLALCCLKGQARMVFDMVGMEQLFEVFDNLKAFEQSFK